MAADKKDSDSREGSDKKNWKGKVSNLIDSASNSGFASQTKQFCRHHTRDAWVAAIVIFGLLMALFNPALGCLIVGAVLGVYFAPIVAHWFKNLNNYALLIGKFRLFLLGAFGVLLLGMMPTFIIAAALAMMITLLLRKRKD